jgi:microcystin-dependent protein
MDPFLGEIMITGFSWAPTGWAFCNGQTLQISQNSALYSLLGIAFGGDGRTTFALPNLQGRIPLGMSSLFPIGNATGEASHTLTISEIPSHNHYAAANGANADVASPAGNIWARGDGAYGPGADTAMNPAAVSHTGGGLPHPNLQPSLVVNFVIATTGIYPPRS